ncbi:bifunctional 2-polyprenyl-6-hydroxyphenol methylase/3-demethylubiquinol 3-O-methyltransferase UbiG [Nonomuraea sp. NEAU-A123]|uniref:class I SAM-dependent methyltransferase n=1 Tax=Nonomuraea sp. NEAU-A123 TaxID=2839649 RepID=UPI001BE3EED2|nr:methyltransferase domain-containing protein [Nonomuraea sp. NEAU-A123]MBT2225529.1 methyltransferase domain-containing protein [Nonomuraea sp. NEAU-A123]
MTIYPHSGTGPGSITPDGSPVEFYMLLRPRGEAEIVGQVTPSGGSVLELGSGVGRVTHALLEHGFEVVAVDESAEMLARIKGAETVLSRIQDLRLHRRFDAVMLASFLVHTSDEDGRRALLSACARHVAPGGAVLIEWTPPETHDAQQVGRGRTDGDITITLAAREEVGPELFSATMRYAHGDRVWTQSFTSRRLSDDDLRAALTEAGLHLDRFLTDDRRWVLAVPTT